mgnify:CR=1 FL=1
MRFVYGLIAIFLWCLLLDGIGYTLGAEGYSESVFILSLAIVTAGAMAGGG